MLIYPLKIVIFHSSLPEGNDPEVETRSQSKRAGQGGTARLCKEETCKADELVDGLIFRRSQGEKLDLSIQNLDLMGYEWILMGCFTILYPIWLAILVYNVHIHHIVYFMFF